MPAIKKNICCHLQTKDDQCPKYAPLISINIFRGSCMSAPPFFADIEDLT